MDASLYKLHTVTRGLTYNYYFSPAHPGKPTLLLVHGFPSTSQDWHKLVSHFRPLGYGLLVPDALGYGGSSRPTDAGAYRMSLQTRDLVEILDHEALGRVVAVGHDWCVVSLRYALERLMVLGGEGAR
jgi:soluble epoxide hydrolase/lipid-phosphate phosphatase